MLSPLEQSKFLRFFLPRDAAVGFVPSSCGKRKIISMNHLNRIFLGAGYEMSSTGDLSAISGLKLLSCIFIGRYENFLRKVLPTFSEHKNDGFTSQKTTIFIFAITQYFYEIRLQSVRPFCEKSKSTWQQQEVSL